MYNVAISVGVPHTLAKLATCFYIILYCGNESTKVHNARLSFHAHDNSTSHIIYSTFRIMKSI